MENEDWLMLVDEFTLPDATSMTTFSQVPMLLLFCVKYSLKKPLLKPRKKNKPKIIYILNNYLADLMSTVFEGYHL